MFVSLNVAEVSPVDAAVITYVPAVVPAVKGRVVAIPLAPVTAESMAVPLENVPLGPLPGAVKVTLVPAIRTGFPCESSTVALSGFVKSAPTIAVCPAPAVARSWVAVLALIVYAGELATGVWSKEVFTLTVSAPAAVGFVAVEPIPASTTTAADELIATGVVIVTLLVLVSVGRTLTSVPLTL
jgi:hypothetical protein